MKVLISTLVFVCFIHLGTSAPLASPKDNDPAKAPTKDDSVTCLVGLTSLSGEYNGDCKKGKANGYGMARGLDQYVGEFKKGLPNGKGVYVWLGGNVYAGGFKDGKMHGYGELRQVRLSENDHLKVHIQEGYWENGKYKGEKTSATSTNAFKILKKQNARRINVSRMGDGNSIEIEPERISYPESLVVNSSSGSVIMNYLSYTSTRIEDVNYPVTLRIQYRPDNRMNASRAYLVTTEVEITEPGDWLIRITP